MSFIRKLGDPVLKSSATPVDRFDDSLRRQVSRMAGIMQDAIGIGLAAPQLGISQRLLVYRVGPDAPLSERESALIKAQYKGQRTGRAGAWLKDRHPSADGDLRASVNVQALSRQRKARRALRSRLEQITLC